MSQWKYNNDNFKERMIGKNKGFVYMITHKETGKIYIGKKIFYHTRKKKISKKEKKETGTRKIYKYEISDSNWKDYWGSGEYLLKDIELHGHDAFSRRILMLCRTEKQMTYYETKYQFIYEILENDSYNESIGGRFFKRDLVNPD